MIHKPLRFLSVWLALLAGGLACGLPANVAPTATFRPTAALPTSTLPPQATATFAIQPTDDHAHTGDPYAGMPTPTMLNMPTPTEAATRFSVAGFQSQFGVADQFVAKLVGVALAPPGQGYQGWLFAEDGTFLSLGVLAPEADGTLTIEWVSRNGENLLAKYTGFQITLEPPEGGAAPNGKVVFSGGFDPSRLAIARRLFVKNDGEPATPLNTAFIPGLIDQTNLAVQHIQNAQNAAAIGALPEMRVHMEHVINIIEGASGARFKDYTADGAAQNPGDGFGVKQYAQQSAALLGDAAAATEVDITLTSLQDQCEQILALDDLATATTQLTSLHTAAQTLQTGALAQLYNLALSAARFDVLAVP